MVLDTAFPENLVKSTPLHYFSVIQVSSFDLVHMSCQMWANKADICHVQCQAYCDPSFIAHDIEYASCCTGNRVPGDMLSNVLFHEDGQHHADQSDWNQFLIYSIVVQTVKELPTVKKLIRFQKLSNFNTYIQVWSILLSFMAIALAERSTSWSAMA